MAEDTKNTIITFSIIGIIPVVWIALLLAPYLNDGLVGIINNISKITENPFNIILCENSLKTVFVRLRALLLFANRKEKEVQPKSYPCIMIKHIMLT